MHAEATSKTAAFQATISEAPRIRMCIEDHDSRSGSTLVQIAHLDTTQVRNL